jgi:hypothetical protein
MLFMRCEKADTLSTVSALEPSGSAYLHVAARGGSDESPVKHTASWLLLLTLLQEEDDDHSCVTLGYDFPSGSHLLLAVDKYIASGLNPGRVWLYSTAQ